MTTKILPIKPLIRVSMEKETCTTSGFLIDFRNATIDYPLEFRGNELTMQFLESAKFKYVTRVSNCFVLDANTGKPFQGTVEMVDVGKGYKSFKFTPKGTNPS